MAQFDVYENTSADNCQLIPYLLDIQSDYLNELPSRLVVPLYVPEAVDERVTERLLPIVRVRGTSCLAMTPELAGVPVARLGARVTNLASARNNIIGALDLLITGI